MECNAGKDEFSTIISIVIVNYNTRDLLENVLYSIRRQVSKISHEVIIVDNGSTDGSQDMVEKSFPEMTLIKRKSNSGFASACNSGIEESHGKFVLFLNSDTEIVDHSVTLLYDYMVRNPEAGITGPANSFRHGLAYPTICPFPDLLFIFLSHTGIRHRYYRNRWINPYRSKWERAVEKGRPEAVDWLSGAGIMVRREVISSIGHLDESYFFYMEETDFCRRAWKRGWEIMFIPYAVIVHHGGGSSEKVKPGLLTLSAALGEIIYFEKHKSCTESILLKFMLILEYVIKILIRCGKGQKSWAYREILKASMGLRVLEITSKDMKD